jgi:putative ABC transport system ATP-binding protein
MNAMADPALLSFRDVWKTYGSGEAQVHALAGVDLTIRRGEFVAIMGPSGSGKSTLMHCLAALDTPTSGEVVVGDVSLSRLKDKALTTLRRERIGFVFQAFNLVPTLTGSTALAAPCCATAISASSSRATTSCPAPRRRRMSNCR